MDDAPTNSAEVSARDALEAVEAARRAAGFSRAELARAADISDSTYTRLLQQPDRRPMPRTLRKLRRALDVLAEGSGRRGAAR